MFPPENLEDLHLIVEQRIEETAQLDFKRELPVPGKNDDLAKDLCAMGNTEGGILIYGVDEDDMGRAKELDPIPVAGAAERVSQVAHSGVDGPLALGAIRTIASEHEQGHGFLVVEVPPSERAPHLVKGTAWGRTSKGNVPLTRRRIGELFARSHGFAEEFGVVVGRPGRVLVERVVDHERGHYLVFKNDGDSECLDADWEWAIDERQGRPPHVFDNPFPLEVFQAGVGVRLPMAVSADTAGKLKVVTRWRDKQGNQHQETWPITW